VRQVGGTVGNLIDVKKHRAWNMALQIFRARVPLLARQVPGPVHDPKSRTAEPLLQPFRRDQKLTHALLAKASRMRRFCRPFFSILVTTTGPISPVERT
jgi:hypothetical protein